MVKHGWSKTDTYRCWNNMKKRCRRTSNLRYGGRGITYDSRWEQFENFLTDMGPKPEGLWLERKDNNLGYYKGNCEWTTPRNQACNRENNNAVPGVRWIKDSKRKNGGRWEAKIRIGKKRILLYIGDSYLTACEARRQAEEEIEVYGENKS